MKIVELKIELPDDVARNAEAEGLFDAKAICEMIEREIRRRAAEDFLRIADKMVEAGLPEITQEDVQAEIDAYRAEKRRARASRA